MSAETPVETRRCERCGAETPNAELERCEFCGTEFVDYAALERVAKARLDRFRVFRESPVYDELMAIDPHEPGGKRLTAENVFIVIFITTILGMATLGMLGTGIFAPLAVLPFALLLFMLYHLFKRPKAEHSGAPLTKQMFLVGPTQSRITGMQGSQAETEVKVTVFDDQNEPHVFRVHERAIEQVIEDTLGVAYLRGDTLIEFQRVEEIPIEG